MIVPFFKVPEAMLGPWASARRSALDMASGLEIKSIVSLKRLFASEREVLESLDPTFCIELAYLFDVAVTKHQSVIQERILSSMPSVDISRTVSQAILYDV